MSWMKAGAIGDFLLVLTRLPVSCLGGSWMECLAGYLD